MFSNNGAPRDRASSVITASFPFRKWGTILRCETTPKIIRVIQINRYESLQSHELDRRLCRYARNGDLFQSTGHLSVPAETAKLSRYLPLLGEHNRGIHPGTSSN